MEMVQTIKDNWRPAQPREENIIFRYIVTWYIRSPGLILIQAFLNDGSARTTHHRVVPQHVFLSFSAGLQWSGDVVAYEEGQDEIDGPKRCREDSHSSPVNLTWLNKTSWLENEQRWFGWMLLEVSWEVPCDAGMRFCEVSISEKCGDFRPTFGTNSATKIRTGVRWNFRPLS